MIAEVHKHNMTENNKKRGNSFRKFFPNIFFSNKHKEKSSINDTSGLKLKTGSTSTGNKYQNPKFIVDKYGSSIDKTKENDERIYENLSTAAFKRNAHDNHDFTSNHSSSSTLVSDNIEIMNQPRDTVTLNDKSKKHFARPQVPPKPHQEILYACPVLDKHQKNFAEIQYPDVYYHSVEKLTDKLTTLDEIEIYRASQAQTHPASVGAEIKKVSTKFLISPKKEAEVRTIQPIRARSLSLDKNGTNDSRSIKKVRHVEKPYNYSAPTSPIAVGHKIPNMPTTVSPYERVKQNMIEAEEKRNSLSRLSNRNTLSPSPRSLYRDGSKTLATADDSKKKEKTRQRIEAFYWQKIKELKQKEDEYLLRQSLGSSMRRSRTQYASYSNSNCSTPTSLVDSRSCSLPRGRDLLYANQTTSTLSSPFIRGVPERRTDSYIKSTIHQAEYDGVQYRNYQKLYGNVISNNQSPIVQRCSLPTETGITQQPKRVSFEGKNLPLNSDHRQEVVTTDTPFKNSKCKTFQSGKDSVVKLGHKDLNNPPLPPIRTTSVKNNPSNKNVSVVGGTRSMCSESESGSEAGEIQRIMHSSPRKEEDWQGDPRIDGGLSDGEASRGPTRGRPSRREDPRRHTLAGNHNIYMHHHHQAGHISTIEIERYNKAQALVNMPEYATVNKYRDVKVNRNMRVDPRIKPHMTHYPQSNNALFDDDPGVMSEVETSSTGFRRGGKQRSSLPVVRTPSKTLERPLVFLQYRSETKRALLPNEITSIDTVKALFVRSFPKQLTMQYMDSAHVKIYIHDSSKDMFYELEDVRAHLRDIRDRSVLRLFEATDIGGGAFPGAVGVGSVPMPPGAAGCNSSTCWDQDQNYFSEPEIDSDYHHQHVHNKNKIKAPAYYMGTSTPSTLPRGGSLMRAFSPATPVPADRVKTPGSLAPSKPVRSYLPGSGSERCFPSIFAAADCPRAHSGDGYMSSPERAAPRVSYEDPYYTQFLGPAAGRGPIAPVIDEEANDTVIIDDTYQMYGINPITTPPRPMPRPQYDARLGAPVDDMQRLRVEKMERQLANLTGLVQKALQVPGSAPPPVTPREDYQAYPSTSRGTSQDAARFASNERPPKLGRDRFQKSVSFEKSVSFSDDPPDMNSPKQHSPQHSADTKPTKPAIKSSTLPRTSSQERDRLKPAPPPKPAGLAGQQMTLAPQKNYSINVTPDYFNQLRILQKQSRDLRIETRNLRRSTLSHSIQMRQMMADTILKIGAIAATFTEETPDSRLAREEEIYRQDMLLLENDLYELEATVERLRGQAANRETRVNMADIERIAMVLSKSSKTVADWKLKFPILQQTMKAKLAAELEKVVRKEKLLEEEPERLELALRRCKKLTGTLVTLKRLACVQEQRLPCNEGRDSPTSSQSSATGGLSSEEYNSENACVAPNANKGGGGRGATGRAADVRPENALDALLDELQTFAKPAERGARGDGPLRRLHSYPSGSDTDASPPVRARGQHPPKPPVPERHPELLLAVRRAPPPPPPRTTSRSPLASPTSPRSPSSPPSPPELHADPADPNDEKNASRQALLEHRHQELLKKQRALQEQYARLQMIQRSGPTLPPNAQPDLKKTGSESNLLTKMNLNLAPASISGSMTHLASDCDKNSNPEKCSSQIQAPDAVATTNKVYETDIL
ncbi:coiled-coil domain-containing protein AGAP005037 isoform X3 [Bicyclus anynana]|uniref:Coiled-coil domain-containing protein AGAP005037 isoform X3 n=1 Tax=Bicyclus anynana TaxID=110368 RepID=A0ABM3M6P4_BICAN|nr:coiled-coil domain-containing protein AGAP005037 isoform X3 [Bicyclus anynana]